MSKRFSRTALADYIASSSDAEDQLARETAAFLIDNGATNELSSLMRDAMEIRAQNSGVVELTASSAFPITSEIEDQIKNVGRKLYPGASRFVIHRHIDKEVIGGVRLQFANASLDLTIESKLHKLRKAIN